MEIVDLIENLPTTTKDPYRDVPASTITVTKVTIR